MSLWTYRRSSAFKRPSDIVLRWSDLTNPRAELARSTDAVVTGVTSSSFRTCRTFGNKSSCPETLVFSFFFFFLPARGGARPPRPPPPPPRIRYWIDTMVPSQIHRERTTPRWRTSVRRGMTTPSTWSRSRLGWRPRQVSTDLRANIHFALCEYVCLGFKDHANCQNNSMFINLSLSPLLFFLPFSLRCGMTTPLTWRSGLGWRPRQMSTDFRANVHFALCEYVCLDVKSHENCRYNSTFINRSLSPHLCLFLPTFAFLLSSKIFHHLNSVLNYNTHVHLIACPPILSVAVLSV